ncbi:adenosylcobinamide-phosphate synthase CbiB [Litorilinea aerophila]|uniref:adenosylcobinamide-phosphate synthase CbiB n=1 Tax=Litorilinea aerophila TaxID=1204385 RepID=UPI001B8723E9|nr:adenosylcobinamide-phosphate synthase CbiB [Litorilinea aerophila]MCC9075394.1 adenosylcobinamide-phosphate synthase CbiB [Litorilinea aerophila]
MRPAGERAWVTGLALLLDLALGDPPNRLHPVAWMGQAIAAAQRRAQGSGRSPLAYLLMGAGIALGGGAAVAVLARAAEWLAARLPRPWGWLLQALLLKSTFSLRGLMGAARAVHEPLAAGDLPTARRLLGWHLVSRDTRALDAGQVAAATIESLAENCSDGVLAPLFYYGLGGLPAAMAYRFVNTGDAMLGYRDPAREWLGKAPARLDDLANLVPARLTAGLLVLAAWLAGENPRRAWRVWRRDHGCTASPNAGHPMAAMAGALGVALAKEGHYVLGEGQPTPTPAEIPRAVKMVWLASLLGVGLLVAGLKIKRLKIG